MLLTTVVGSYPVPDWLKAHSQTQTLVDAMCIALRAQESAGIDVISDGELGRWDLARGEPGGMVERFVRPMSGVVVELTRAHREAFHKQAATAYRADPPGVVVGPIDDGRLDLGREWQRARSLTTRPLKFTVTSPYMMAKVVLDQHYRDVHALAMAFADVLARQVGRIDATVLQVDEPNLPGSSHDGPLAAEAINRVLDASVSKEKGVHLCFGNYGGQTIQQGDYRRLIDFLNRLHCDHVVLESVRRPEDELRCLKELRAEIRLGLGVIDVKDLQIETPDAVAERIERLVGMFGAERLAYVHPDCGLSVLPRKVADGKLRALRIGRDLFMGQQPV